MQISAVWAVGLAEGVSHVNWRKVLTIVGWGVGSLIPILLAAAALLAQGKRLECCVNVMHMQLFREACWPLTHTRLL